MVEFTSCCCTGKAACTPSCVCSETRGPTPPRYERQCGRTHSGTVEGLHGSGHCGHTEPARLTHRDREDLADAQRGQRALLVPVAELGERCGVAYGRAVGDGVGGEQNRGAPTRSR